MRSELTGPVLTEAQFSGLLRHMADQNAQSFALQLVDYGCGVVTGVVLVVLFRWLWTRK